MTMSMNVRDYVKTYDNFLDLDFCKTVVQEIESNSWEKHRFYRAQNQDHISYEDDLAVSYSDSKTFVSNGDDFPIDVLFSTFVTTAPVDVKLAVSCA